MAWTGSSSRSDIFWINACMVLPMSGPTAEHCDNLMIFLFRLSLSMWTFYSRWQGRCSSCLECQVTGLMGA